MTTFQKKRSIANELKYPSRLLKHRITKTPKGSYHVFIENQSGKGFGAFFTEEDMIEHEIEQFIKKEEKKEHKIWKCVAPRKKGIVYCKVDDKKPSPCFDNFIDNMKVKAMLQNGEVTKEEVEAYYRIKNSKKENNK